MSGSAAPRDDDPLMPVPVLDSFPPTGTPTHTKLSSWDFYTSLGSPKYVVAPMVDQSELAWRILSRRHGAQLVYTPMINTRRFTQMTSSKGKEHDADFWIAKDANLQEEGAPKILDANDTDDPVFVQFCANDPELLLQAARVVEPYCSAVDLNLGCPQQIARRGHYGAFLQSDWHLIFRLINTLHLNLRIPVTAKMRVYDSVERTVAYAQMLERAGAQIIAVHGRTREMKGHKTGLADWMKIKAVKEAVKVPVFTNGNILYHDDVDRALQMTGADGVMSAEGNLYNPAIFGESPSEPSAMYPLAPALPFPRIVDLAREYISICEQLHTPTAGSAIKGHLFRLARPILEVHRDLRPALGTCSVNAKGKSNTERYKPFRDLIDRIADLLEKDENDPQYMVQIEDERKRQSADKGHTSEPIYIPHWLAQPYYRKTLPPADEEADAKAVRLEQRQARLKQTAAGVTPITDVQAEDEAQMLESDAGPSKASQEMIKEKSIQEAIDEAQRLKSSANALFEKRQYNEALLEYTEALNHLPPRERKDGDKDAEEEQIAAGDTGLAEDATGSREKGKDRLVEEDDDAKAARQLRAIIYANIAASHLKLEQFKEAVVACNEALKDDPDYLKALHRRAQANEQVGTWSALTSALEDYHKMQSLPHPASLDASLQAGVRRLPRQIEETSAKEKEEMMSKLKGIGNSFLGYFGLSTDNFQMQKGDGGGYSLNFVK